jgi:uncharacterized protein (TIGR00369 family)
MEITNTQYRERVRKFLERQHFMHLIGFDLQVIEHGRTEGRMPVRQEHKQQKGLVHGGVIATVADIVAGFAAYTMVPEHHHVVTGEIKVSYFRPGIGEELIAKGYVVKPGKKLQFCEAEVFCVHQGEQILIAKATTTMVTIFPDPE